jgi:hypothetical protein
VRLGVKIGRNNGAKEGSVLGRDGTSLLLSNKNAYKAITQKLDMCSELEELAIANCRDDHIVAKAAARRKRFHEQICLELTTVRDWYDYLEQEERRLENQGEEMLFGPELQQAIKERKQQRLLALPPPQSRNLSLEQVLSLWAMYQKHLQIKLEGLCTRGKSSLETGLLALLPTGHLPVTLSFRSGVSATTGCESCLPCCLVCGKIG